VKNGNQFTRITLPIMGINPTYLHLKKQRLMCQADQRNFTAKTTIIQRNSYISHKLEPKTTGYIEDYMKKDYPKKSAILTSWTALR